MAEAVQIRHRDPQSFAEVVGPRRADDLALVAGAEASPHVKVVAVRKGVDVPEQEVIRFFPPDQIIQDVR